LRYLRAHGYDDVAINLHFLPQLIRDAIGDGARYGVRVHYSFEDQLLGTAGALRRLADWLGDESDVLVMYGDLLIDHDLGALRSDHARRRADATLLLHQRPGSNSLVAMNDDQRITGFVERPTEEDRARHPYPWTHSGLSLLRTALVGLIPDGTPADLPRDIYAPNLATKRLYGHALAGYRCAIDSPARYEAAARAFESGEYRAR
jgi:mannose-1-phosphate guanylyltransferase